MKQNLMAGMTDPSVLVQMVKPPVSKVEPKQKEKAAWYAAYLDLEAGQNAPMELREAIEGMFWLHENMDVQRQVPQALNQGIVAAAGQAPAALGGAMLQQQQQPPPQEDQQQQQDHEAQLQDAEQQHEQDLKDKEADVQVKVAQIQGQSQLMNAQLQGENAKALEKIKGENQLKVAKARPKPTVRKSA